MPHVFRSTLFCCSTTATSPLCKKDLQWMAASMARVGGDLSDCGHPAAAAEAQSVACNAAIAALACTRTSLGVTVSLTLSGGGTHMGSDLNIAT
jgi:hypothetical protein